METTETVLKDPTTLALEALKGQAGVLRGAADSIIERGPDHNGALTPEVVDNLRIIVAALTEQLLTLGNQHTGA